MIRSGPIRGTRTEDRSVCIPAKAPCPDCYDAVATYHSHTRGSNYSPPNMGDFRGAALSGVAAFTGHGLLNVSVINTVGPGTASPVLGNPNLGRPPGGITSFNPRHILPEND